jgi:hypothetical protein
MVIMQAQIWTALNRALKSTIHNESRTPPSVLPLMEGGGGPRLVLKSKQRSAVRNPTRRSTDRGDFRTPLGILSLIKGGGPGMNLPHIEPPVTCVVALLVHESHPPHAV